MQLQKLNSLKFYPKFAFFFELGIVILMGGFFIDAYYDYRENRPLSDILIFLIIMGVLFLTLVGLVHYFLFNVIEFDLSGNISLYSHFTRKFYSWDDIDSLKFIISNKASYISPIHGFLFVLIAPYWSKIRLVRISLKLKDSREISFYLDINLGKVNQLFSMLEDSERFEIERSPVNFSELMGKKYNHPWRELWNFQITDRYSKYITSDLLICEKNGQIWNGGYSKSAKWMFIMGIIQAIAVVVILYAIAAHRTFQSNNVLFTSCIIIIIITIIIGFILLIRCPEMKKIDQEF